MTKHAKTQKRRDSVAHTPGPWDSYDYGDRKYPVVKIEDKRCEPIAYIDRADRGHDVSAANGRLIARAPELYDLARKLVIVCDDRLAALKSESERLDDFFSEEEATDIAEQIGHYGSLRYEASECIAKIEGRED